MIMNCISLGEDHEVNVVFSSGVGIKKLLLSYAHLIKVD
jgi:hypothetical protein